MSAASPFAYTYSEDDDAIVVLDAHYHDDDDDDDQITGGSFARPIYIETESDSDSELDEQDELDDAVVELDADRRPISLRTTTSAVTSSSSTDVNIHGAPSTLPYIAMAAAPLPYRSFVRATRTLLSSSSSSSSSGLIAGSSTGPNLTHSITHPIGQRGSDTDAVDAVDADVQCLWSRPAPKLVTAAFGAWEVSTTGFGSRYLAKYGCANVFLFYIQDMHGACRFIVHPS
jgi:hypothetical protein